MRPVLCAGLLRMQAFLMTKYAYVDESGTREHQKVMTVSLVLFEGRRSAEKLHERIMCTLFDDYLERRRLFKKKAIHRLPSLHYSEMNSNDRVLIAKKLGVAAVSCYVAYYWHDGNAIDHELRFAIYTNLVKEAILLATRHHNELAVTVAQQGGWQGYEKKFEAELKSLEYDTTSDGKVYRKLFVDLQPARHPGIQLSDFYAGVCRDYVLNADQEQLLAPYRLIERQVVLELSSFVAGVSREKG